MIENIILKRQKTRHLSILIDSPAGNDNNNFNFNNSQLDTPVKTPKDIMRQSCYIKSPIKLYEQEFNENIDEKIEIQKSQEIKKNKVIQRRQSQQVNNQKTKLLKDQKWIQERQKEETKKAQIQEQIQKQKEFSNLIKNKTLNKKKKIEQKRNSDVGQNLKPQFNQRQSLDEKIQIEKNNDQQEKSQDDFNTLKKKAQKFKNRGSMIIEPQQLNVDVKKRMSALPILQQTFKEQQEINIFKQKTEQLSTTLKAKQKISQLMVQQKEQKRLREILKDYDKDIKLVIKVQAKVKMLFQKKKFQKFKQKYQNRYESIKEQFESEKKYILLLVKIQMQLLPKIKTMVSEFDYQMMFGIFQQILQTNQTYFTALKQQLNKYHPNKKFFDKVTQYISYFKIYICYCQTYEEAQQIFISNQFDILAAEQFNLHDIFYKVVQRLPQYVMLLKETMRHTDKSHIDYPHLIEAYDLFQKINVENDEQLQLQNDKNTIFKYKKMFPQIKVEINKKFKFQQEMNFIQGCDSQKVNCLFFDKMLIITDLNIDDTKAIKFIEFDDYSYVKSKISLKNYQNVFIINGVLENLVFSSSEKEEIIQRIKENILPQNNHVQIETQLSLNRPDDNSIQTYYAIEIQKNEKSQLIFFKHQQLQIIEKLAKKANFKFHNLHVPIYNLSKSKLIESRQLVIQNILQKIIQQITEKDTDVIEYLGINQQLFQNSDDINLYQKNDQIKGQVCYYIQQIQINNKKVFYQNKDQQNHQILIHLPFQSQMPLDINKKFRAIDIIYKFSQNYKLKHFNDLSLWIQFDKQSNFILDNDEILRQYYDFESKNIFSFFKSDIKFFIRKQFTLPIKYEIDELVQNLPKLQLYVNQILNDLIQFNCLNLDENLIQIVLALYLFAKYEVQMKLDDSSILKDIQFFKGQQLLKKYSKEELLQNIKLIWPLINQEMLNLEKKDDDNHLLQQQQHWKNLIMKNRSKSLLSQQNLQNLQKNVQNNYFIIFIDKFEFSKIFKYHYKISSKQDDPYQKRQFMVLLAILQILENNQNFGFQFFNAKVYKKKLKNEFLHQKQLPDNIKLGINWKGIKIFCENYTELIDLLLFDQIISIKYEPKSIIFEIQFNQTTTMFFRFDSENVWEIRNQIQIYKQINDLI